MPTYRIPVRYVFNGVYTVEADNLVDAMSHIKDDCGCTLGEGIHSTVGNVDWDFNVHPTLKISIPRRID